MGAGGLCETCLVPGHCCRALVLAGGEFARHCDTVEDVQRELRNEGEQRYDGPAMPFQPLLRRRDGIWVFWCPRLDAKTGRCLDYDNRPNCCRSYAPGSDPLCVHYWPETA